MESFGISTMLGLYKILNLFPTNNCACTLKVQNTFCENNEDLNDDQIKPKVTKQERKTNDPHHKANVSKAMVNSDVYESWRLSILSCNDKSQHSVLNNLSASRKNNNAFHLHKNKIDEGELYDSFKKAIYSLKEMPHLKGNRKTEQKYTNSQVTTELKTGEYEKLLQMQLATDAIIWLDEFLSLEISQEEFKIQKIVQKVLKESIEKASAENRAEIIHKAKELLEEILKDPLLRTQTCNSITAIVQDKEMTKPVVLNVCQHIGSDFVLFHSSTLLAQTVAWLLKSYPLTKAQTVDLMSYLIQMEVTQQTTVWLLKYSFSLKGDDSVAAALTKASAEAISTWQETTTNFFKQCAIDYLQSPEAKATAAASILAYIDSRLEEKTSKQP